MIRTMEVYQGRIAVVTIQIPDEATEEEMEAIAFKAAAESSHWVEVETEKWVRLAQPVSRYPHS